jgi:hypothetical protein
VATDIDISPEEVAITVICTSCIKLLDEMVGISSPLPEILART